MRKEIDIAFALLKSALDGTTPDVGELEASQWWNLFRLLQQNHVSALTSEAFAHMEQKPPREVLIPWLSERQKAESWYRHQSEVQQEIVALMTQNGIETLVLKGTRLAQLYPHPELREFGDLDLYFYNKHNEADTLAEDRLRVTVSNDAHHHSKYSYRGITVESHYDFINNHTPRSNRRYEARLKELVPSANFEVLFLLRHMAGHFFASRLTLRDMVDWHLLTKTIGGDVDWQMVGDIVEESGMAEFYSVLNSIIAQRFGTQQASHSVIRSLVEKDIVYGNELLRGEKEIDGISRLVWKFKRYQANRWKQPLVYSHDSRLSLLISSLTSHAMKPQSILHKM